MKGRAACPQAAGGAVGTPRPTCSGSKPIPRLVRFLAGLLVFGFLTASLFSTVLGTFCERSTQLAALIAYHQPGRAMSRSP